MRKEVIRTVADVTYQKEDRIFLLSATDADGQITLELPVEAMDLILCAAESSVRQRYISAEDIRHSDTTSVVRGVELVLSDGLLLTFVLEDDMRASFLIPSDQPESELTIAAGELVAALRRANPAPH